MLPLRDYQQAPVRAAVRFLRNNTPEPSLIVLPTGWGKSVLTAYCARYMNEGDCLLVVQPSKELLEQNYAKYETLRGDDGEKASIFSASLHRKDIGRITYATIGSIKSIGSRFREMGFTRMLIDEAHLYPRKEESMLGQFLADSGIECVLGITATPLKLESFSEKNGDRFDKWSQLTMLTNPSPDGSLFRQVLHVGQIQEMTDPSRPFWSPLVYEQVPFDAKELRYNTTGSEFSKDSDIKSYIANHVRENIYAALDYHGDRRHCVVFVPSVEEAQILADGYPSAAAVSGETPPKERRDIIAAFREGRIRVIFNVCVLGTGFDYPGIDMIVFGTSMASVARYYQFTGRGVRQHPDKKDCLVVDFGGNTARFGRIEDIVYEKTDRWRMYGTGGQLLTGLPIRCLGSVWHSDITDMQRSLRLQETMTFGKHKGKAIRDLPASYMTWYLETRSERSAQTTVSAVISALENRVRDTRNEPEPEIMPTGQHAGKKIADIPRNYLSWFYSTTKWNEYNDSLRRAIETAYGGVPFYAIPHKRMK